MNIHLKPAATLLYGPLAAALLCVFGAALAQDEAVRYYDSYLAAMHEQPMPSIDQNAAQNAVVTDLDRRINCLELTRMPCKRKAVVRAVDPRK